MTKPKSPAAKPKRKAKPPAKPKPPALSPAELRTRVCALIADGYTLRQIAKLPDMPAKSTILAWAAADEAFRVPYSRAMELRAEALADEIIDISDDGSNDWREREVKEGWVVQEVNQENINRSRLRVDARKWLLSKLLPKKYGDKVGVEHSGEIDMGIAGLLAAIDGKTRGLPGK